MTDKLNFADLEKVYDLLAIGIDQAGPDKEALFLSKLCLLLSHNIRDITVIENAIEVARTQLDS